MQRTLGSVAGLMGACCCSRPAAGAAVAAERWPGPGRKSWNNQTTALAGCCRGWRQGSAGISGMPTSEETSALAVGRRWCRSSSSGCRRGVVELARPDDRSTGGDGPGCAAALCLIWAGVPSSRWGRWSLACLLTLTGAILVRTQLPWYSHPLWLPLALLSSAAGLAGGAPAFSVEFTWQPKAPLALAALAASYVLVRARTTAPAAGTKQLQHHRQQPGSLPQPGGCAGPWLVGWRMLAAL